MFANSYQNGYFTEVWDSRVNTEKNTFYKQLFRKIPSFLKNFYDKDVKSFIYQLEGNQKLSFPHDDKQQFLSLHQRYLVLQVFIPIGMNWSIELGINDLNNSKKRINITTAAGKQELKYFSFRYPLENGSIEKGIWMFLAIDVYSFCSVFKNTVFRSLDSVVICSACKIRRMFTMKEWTQFQIPKNYWLPSGIPQTMQLIQFREAKGTSSQTNLLNISIQNSKMLQSKINQNAPSVLRHSQKIPAFEDKSYNKAFVKLPGVNPRTKEVTPMKSSKLTQKIQMTKNEISKEHNLLGKSNRSLTKGEIIIEKSKLRLNSLQEKEQQILSRLNSEDNRFSEKIQAKQKPKIKHLKNENLFKSDLLRSQFSQSGADSKISRLGVNNSPKMVKMKKKFEQDNIFKQESYSSSYSKRTEKYQDYSSNNKDGKAEGKKKTNQNLFFEQSSDDNEQVNRHSFGKDKKESRVLSKVAENKHREEIIEEDVWTDDQNEVMKLETPIEQIIQSQEAPSQTIITRQNNQELITKRSLNSLKATNELELIYDQMIGCYYHPQTNTYYEIRK